MKTGKNKKIMGAVLAAAVLASSVLPIYVADGSQSGTMKLTVSKEAGYILTIPSDQNIVFEKGDYLAMVLGAFWALWPALAITLAVIVGISLFFL